MLFLLDELEDTVDFVEPGLLSLILYAAIICWAAGRKYLYASSLFIFFEWVSMGAPFEVSAASGKVLDYVKGSESRINLLSIERRS